MKHVNLRLPDDLHATLAAAAKHERRSLNNMIIVCIEQRLTQDGTGAPPDRNAHP